MTTDFAMGEAPPASPTQNGYYQPQYEMPLDEPETIRPLNSRPPLNLLELPQEMLLNVMSSLDSTNDLKALMNTCRRFHHLFYDHQQGISKEVANREFLPIAFEVLKLWDENGMPWPGRLHLHEWTLGKFGARYEPTPRIGRVNFESEDNPRTVNGYEMNEIIQINFVRANGRRSDRAWFEHNENGRRTLNRLEPEEIHPDRRKFGMAQLERMLYDKTEITKLLYPLLIEEDPDQQLPVPSGPAPESDPALLTQLNEAFFPSDPTVLPPRIPVRNPRRKRYTSTELDRLYTAMYNLLLLGADFHCGDLIKLRTRNPQNYPRPHLQSPAHYDFQPLQTPSRFQGRNPQFLSRPAHVVGGTGRSNVPDSTPDQLDPERRRTWYRLDRLIFDYKNLIDMRFSEVVHILHVCSHLANTWNYASIFLSNAAPYGVRLYSHLLDRFIDPQKVPPHEYDLLKSQLLRAIDNAVADGMQNELHRLAYLSRWNQKGFGGVDPRESKGLRGLVYKRKARAWVINGEGTIVQKIVVLGSWALDALDDAEE
ncbi:hypothetical protein BJ508DRAFT_89705 [Ascobolus immersus RN42]|uniref:F-box domain-containing protein n=1 Tax=Ascobolus immersus RN42 TaxID=1160509 RepID=A0A3N4HAM7_ASCIM|nr:hypothetical protein BJ508DRAFT_89705 [Ascobolus immersus RN42]